MDTQPIAMDRSEARELYEKYVGALHYGTAIDREVARSYRLLSQGKLIIKALASVAAAGLNEDHLPKLALATASARRCHLELRRNGSALFAADTRWPRSKRARIDFGEGSFAPPETSFPLDRWNNNATHRSFTRLAEAIIPIVPAHLKPKHSLDNYHILWEADWRAVPRDPYLLRRLGKGDLWLVVAMWDLTEVERAALQARV